MLFYLKARRCGPARWSPLSKGPLQRHPIHLAFIDLGRSFRQPESHVLCLFRRFLRRPSIWDVDAAGVDRFGFRNSFVGATVFARSLCFQSECRHVSSRASRCRMRAWRFSIRPETHFAKGLTRLKPMQHFSALLPSCHLNYGREKQRDRKVRCDPSSRSSNWMHFTNHNQEKRSIVTFSERALPRPCDISTVQMFQGVLSTPSPPI
jgi:hypothetical protein